MPRVGTVSPSFTAHELRQVVAWLRLEHRPRYSLAVVAMTGIDPGAVAMIERMRARAMARRLLKASKRGSRRYDGSSFRIELSRLDAQWLASALPQRLVWPSFMAHPLAPVTKRLLAALGAKRGAPPFSLPVMERRAVALGVDFDERAKRRLRARREQAEAGPRLHRRFLKGCI